MPTYRTKDRTDAERFCRSLLARGYRQAPAIHHLRQTSEGTFRIYRERHRRKPTRWLRVAYYEPRRGPFRKVPHPLDHQPRASGMRCIEAASHGKAYSRGLCPNCYHRWKYWSNHAHRARLRARKHKERAGERAA